VTIDAAFYGWVVRDAEAKISAKGKPYCRFTVRCGGGEGAQFVSVVYCGDHAEGLAAKLCKDMKVYVEGQITMTKWTDQNGVERHGLSVMSFHARIPAIGRSKEARKKDAAEPKREQREAAVGGPAFNDEIPFMYQWR